MTGSTRAAFHLSALVVAAGTILGLASGAAAQSRLERAEKALVQAQRELEQARRESARPEGRSASKQEFEVRAEVAGDCPQGCEPCDEDCDGGACDGQVGVTSGGEWTTSPDDEFEVVVGQPGQQRIEKKIILRGGEGHNCPTCGRPMEEGQGGGRRIQGHPIELHGMMQGGHGEGGPHVQMFRRGGDEDGQVVVLGDRQGRGFNWRQAEGDDQNVIVLRGEGQGGEWRAQGRQGQRIQLRREGGEDEVIVLRGDAQGGEWRTDGPAKQEKRIQIRRQGGEGAEGGGEAGEGRKSIRIDGGEVTGKIIIIGPDGERQEFDLGGKPGKGDAGSGGGSGGSGGKATLRRVPRVQFEEFRDGEAIPAHPVPGDHTIRVRKVVRGSAL